MSGFKSMAIQALGEIRSVLERMPEHALDPLLDELLQARRIATYGVGREGLMMKALCMRLFHLGLDAHVVGDMTTPPLGQGDLLLVSAGPGYFSTVDALVGVARQAGARTGCITAQPEGPTPQRCDLVIHLPAQTMANDQAAAASILPMGSLYEAVQLVVFDLVSILLRERLGQTPAQMRSRHTNLE
ncbi:SIS domain-containing protein [Meiothermus granaticius]|uniref:3-hexulose-6-phosphate isomerase n=1 Tax=Meiothermus granaticius NBRC 107808 TaxID=1227551 RepID=A0A399F9A1_9DEIN|nr:SIS domain-containing protein [Meiothermus granaticius]RIH91492.1 3-hexulose-6-phosphate isomerase [Meiothermus granaticius NBRC 107808]GEM88272.1 hexulose-6-phosphate isomerase [Meiothermus granaticius NBRC 107808]